MKREWGEGEVGGGWVGEVVGNFLQCTKTNKNEGRISQWRLLPLGFELGTPDPEAAYLPNEPRRFPTRKYVDIFLERNQLNVM